MIGERIGNFKIVQQLGQGGMGAVFLGEHEKVGTRVAIKMLLPHISENKVVVERFFNEAVAAGKIQHVGVAKVFDVGFLPDGRAYLIMEYLPGETLGQRLSKLGRLSVPHIAEINKQICAILDAVHKAGITHRDLKPENVFLVPDDEIGERVRLVDFGIAKLSTVSGNLTSTTAGAMGTPAYMSPEQWLSSRNVDWRSDAYSLGCMTYEMIAGRPPFSFETLGEACAKHLNEQPVRLGSIAVVPPQLDTLVMALLAKQPEQRPASMRDIGLQFAQLAGQPAMPSPTPAPVPRPPQVYALEAATVREIPVRPSDLATVQAPHQPLAPPTIDVTNAAPRRPTPRMIPIPQAPVFTPTTPAPQPASSGRWKLGLAAVAIAGGATTAIVLVQKNGKRRSTDSVESTEPERGSTTPGETAPPRQPGTTEVRAGSAASGSAVDPSLPAEVDGTMVGEAFRSVKPSALRCGEKATEKGVVKITVTVNPDGSMASAVVKETFDEALGKCIAGEVMLAKFPKTQQGGTFVYPFLF